MSERNSNKNAAQSLDGGVTVITDPKVKAVVEPVVKTEASVPAVEVEKTEVVPLVEPVAVVPSIVYEQTAATTDGTLKEPIIDVKQPSARRVRVICEGTLGIKRLMKGDMTDDPEYVALLNTRRGRTLVEEVRSFGRGYDGDEPYSRRDN